MNDNVCRLYSDAVEHAFSLRFIPGPERTLQEAINDKFSELIINKCLELCDDKSNFNNIKSYFGVK